MTKAADTPDGHTRATQQNESFSNNSEEKIRKTKQRSASKQVRRKFSDKAESI